MNEPSLLSVDVVEDPAPAQLEREVDVPDPGAEGELDQPL